jgi:glyoxylase-like metal-dependent hydrolase (beta-lactamase superfamily II)
MSHILLPAHNASTWTGPTGNNTYLLPGRIPTLVDAGVGKPEHLDAIAHELAGRPLAQVLITHGHSDHVNGVPALVVRWPEVRVRQFGAGNEPILDGEAIAAGDGVVTAIHTPGHAEDHCCFRDGPDLFCGDLARSGGTIVIPARRGGDLAVYLASLDRVRALGVGRLLPGHGPVIDDPEAVIAAYVRHRRQRDAQILDVLAVEGSSTPEHVVSRIYAGLAPILINAAAETVLAHLRKLSKEGRVAEHDGRWTRIPNR